MTVTDSLQPILVIAEPSQLVRALLVPDASSGSSGATLSASLYKIGPDGSTTTMALLASLDAAAASATPWSPFRPKEMLLASPAQKLSKGDVLAITGKTSAWNGTLSLRIRRVLD